MSMGHLSLKHFAGYEIFASLQELLPLFFLACQSLAERHFAFGQAFTVCDTMVESPTVKTGVQGVHIADVRKSHTFFTSTTDT